MIRLMDWIIPRRASEWGRLTVEPLAWHIDQLRYAFAEAHATVVAPFVHTFGDIVNVVADAARAFPDIFPIITESQPVNWPGESTE